MKSRKELKKNGLKSLKKHYLIFVLLCLIAAFLGSEFSNSLSITKIEKQFWPSKNEVVNKVKSDVNNKVEEKIGKDTTASKKVDKIKKNTEKKYKKMTSNKRGVFASVVNMVDSGSLYLTLVYAFKSMVGTSSVGILISVIISLVVFGVYWFFFVNIYKVLLRRLFLEGRVYEKVSLKKLLFLVRVKKWFKATRSMARLVIYETLWSLTIVGGIIKRYSYFLVPYIIAENPDIDGKTAIKMSRDMMNGHKMECFILDLSFIGWRIIGMITFGLFDLFFTEPYEVSTFAEYYANLRKIAKEKSIPNADLLCDKYLYEKADSKLLNDTYYKSLKDITYKEYKPTTAKEKIEDVFGIVLSSEEEEKEYEKNKVNELKIKSIQLELKGKKYPDKLYIIKEKEKRKRFEVVNYLRHYRITSLILMFFAFAFVP